METVILVLHVFIVAALIGVILLQRSEGGALGIGGSQQFFSPRSTANILTRVTAVLAAAFMITSLGLALLAKERVGEQSVFDRLTGNQPAADELKSGDAEEKSLRDTLDPLAPVGGITEPILQILQKLG